MTQRKRDIKSLLTARDRHILDQTTSSEWIPADPVEAILPYVPDDAQKPEHNSVEDRRAKSKEVMEGYDKISKECDKLKKDIEERCKNVVIDLQPQDNLRVIEAVRRVFGTDGRNITFQMYQRCIKEMAKRSENAVPKPTKMGE